MHPRYIHFPGHGDYSAQPNVFCPYVMSVAQPDYRSASLNIDSFGFRYQYDHNGELIELHSVRKKYKECILLLGNSTAFGVSLTNDRKSLGHYFGTEDIPCLNLSVRGATMQQELSIFLTYKHLLPNPRKIVLLTGICDISLATQPQDLWSLEVGGMHCIDIFFKQHYERYERSGGITAIAKKSFLDRAENFYCRSVLLQKLFNRLVRSKSCPSITLENFKSNLNAILLLMDNSIQTWGWVKLATKADIQVVLQPVLGWNNKQLSTIEASCIKADTERVPAIQLYANSSVHNIVHSYIAESCKRNDVGFIDSNFLFDTNANNETFFSDICHLTDQGTQYLSNVLHKAIFEFGS